MDLSHLTDVQLMDQIAAVHDAVKAAESQLEPLKAEQLKRQTATGETSIDHNGLTLSLAREAFSAAWLKRTYGYGPEDLPDDCRTEKITIVLDEHRTMAWLTKDGATLPPTYSLRITRKKARVS